MRICPICGRRKGGSSSAKEVGTPFKRVLESVHEASIDASTLRTTNMDNKIAEPIFGDWLAVKNTQIKQMRDGKRPLQGMKAFVMMAMSLSLGESMILAPVTAAALQPKPMQVVSACLPQALHFLNALSRLNATLGK